ncbi:MAG TPA: DddA-like double-stranded DNA deaminase toxin [Pseudonocardiaceae bacterium]|nr:DddA-like double-stranded DNA deaminase toxin [Pseudonocardiaceae bacterium]
MHQRRRAEAVRRELRRIGRSGYGAETKGAWINDDGTAEPISSGTATPWYRRTRAVLAGLGRRNTALDTHCEAQAVVRMQQEGKRHAMLVLSRPPCGVGETPSSAVHLRSEAGRTHSPPAAGRFDTDDCRPR